MLTYHMAEKALDVFEPYFHRAVELGIAKRPHLHVVVVDPKVRYTEDYAGNRTRTPPTLAERSFTDGREWEYDYKRIARGKGHLSWRERMSTREVIFDHPHLLRQGDVRHPGGVILRGLVTAGSGVDWWIDEAFAYSIAGLCLGLSGGFIQQGVIPDRSIDFLPPAHTIS